MRDVELATGIADTVLSRLERGELPLIGRWLHALARFYETPPTRLIEEMRRWSAREDQAQTAEVGG